MQGRKLAEDFPTMTYFDLHIMSSKCPSLLAKPLQDQGCWRSIQEGITGDRLLVGEAAGAIPVIHPRPVS